MAKITITEEGVTIDGTNIIGGLRLLLGAYLSLSDLYIKDHPADCIDCTGYNNTIKMRETILKEIGAEELI